MFRLLLMTYWKSYLLVRQTILLVPTKRSILPSIRNEYFSSILTSTIDYVFLKHHLSSFLSLWVSQYSLECTWLFVFLHCFSLLSIAIPSPLPRSTTTIHSSMTCFTILSIICTTNPFDELRAFLKVFFSPLYWSLGSIFSVILCYYYYHRFERDYLSPFFPSHCQDTFIFRYIDDYLCISTSKESILQLKHVLLSFYFCLSRSLWISPTLTIWLLTPTKFSLISPSFSLFLPLCCPIFIIVVFWSILKHINFFVIIQSISLCFLVIIRYTNCKATHLFHFPVSFPLFSNHFHSIIKSSLVVPLLPIIAPF